MQPGSVSGIRLVKTQHAMPGREDEKVIVKRTHNKKQRLIESCIVLQSPNIFIVLVVNID